MTLPEQWKNTFVLTLDVLLFMREKILAGTMPEMFFGRLDAWVLDGFVCGVEFHLSCCGAPDREYMDFIRWLRDVKGELPSPGGWAGKYLEDFGGDHQAAILTFLDRCAEFVTLHRAS